MTKYKEYFQKMLEENKEIFDEFAALSPEQKEFNQKGEKVLAIVREWEDRLCRTSEKAGYGSFTGNLSEKFQAEVKTHFPLIDHIGVIPEKFEIKRINLQN